MNDAMRELYQEVIMDHNKSPRNFSTLANADREKAGHNPLCGDNVTVYLKFDNGNVADIQFQGSGCAISKASASMMTQAVKGKTVEQAEALFENFHRLVTREGGDPDPEVLGKLSIFAGVGEFPARVKCASLAWHTMHAALTQSNDPVSTE